MLVFFTQAHAELRLEIVQSMDFGIVTNENGTCKMKNSGVLVGQQGQTCFGTGQPAKFKIFGDPNMNVVITTFESVIQSGVKLVPRVGSPVKTLNSRGRKTFKVPASLVFEQAGSGVMQLDYTVSINYE
jgi:hypothetical protein